jgi:hypothetical protein
VDQRALRATLSDVAMAAESNGWQVKTAGGGRSPA